MNICLKFIDCENVGIDRFVKLNEVFYFDLSIDLTKDSYFSVILFALCWLPIQIFNLIAWLFPVSLDTDLQYNLYVGLYFASHWLSMSHSFINPLIYSYMSTNFRVRKNGLFRISK
jgi:hypothetical protein